jgi:DNA mismatch repair protein MutL
MARIRILDESLSNRIAAGEVVERPASVVKELLENAVDAGATRVDTMVRDAGMTWLRVVDNGCGMDSEDARLAFERHATSKIESDRDLFRIRTLGFRGEALPSIASVSRVTLKTRTGESESGTIVIVEGGRVVSVGPTASPVGTDIEVKDLFYNTPARLKYIKTLSTEMGHVADVVTRVALAQPGVAFHLSSNGKTVLRTPGNGNLLHAITSVFGMEMARMLIPVSWSNTDYTIEGWIGKPELTRANRTHLYFIVNGRVVRSPGLTAAVLRAYQTRLPVHRYPVCFLVIAMDPTLLDVNVHPSKLEVRFSEEKDLMACLEHALADTLRNTVAIPSPVFWNPLSRPAGQGGLVPRGAEQATISGETVREPADPGFAWSASRELRNAPPLYTVRRPAETAYQTAALAAQSPADTDMAGGQQWSSPLRPSLRPVAQVLGMYVVAEHETGLYIIDQHAAHEKILYEKFNDRLMREGIRSLPLLVPVGLEYPPSDSEMLRQYQRHLQDAGIEMEPFGPHTYLVRSIPDMWEGLDAQRLLQELIDTLLEQGKLEDPRDFVRTHIVMKACKAAIKANMRLSMQEMQALCDQLLALKDPFTCPHGRPVIIHFSRYELEKLFKRVM